MEYIKKEELIKGEIYHVQDGDFWMIGLVTKSNNGDNNWSLRGDATYITSKNKFEINTSWAYKSNTRTYRLTTPEEKHWLNEAIRLDKFITFEEAMKTFIPEIEPLPQFKVIESIETITKVENNEGNQFFIGDKVKTLTNNIYIITGFKYNENKTNILAIFDNKNSFIIVGIDKIEHYIEPKVEETLLEKAKRLYPIGTKFKCLVTGKKYKIPENTIFEFGSYDGNAVFSYVNNNIFHKHYENNNWAKIIE